MAGDEVLRTLGAKLTGRVRATDFLGRYGGEEFLLVMPGAPTQTPFLPFERRCGAIQRQGRRTQPRAVRGHRLAKFRRY